MHPLKNRARSLGLMVLCALMVIGLSAFGGCASTPSNPQQGVFATQQAYNRALEIGAWYGELPTCGSPGADRIFCSKPDVVDKIKAAKDVASPSIAAAQATVRNPQFDASTSDKILISAQAAVAVLTAITDPLLELLNQAVEQGKAQPISTSAPAWMYESDAVHTASLNVVALLALFNQLLGLVPVGTAWYRRLQADRAVLEAIKQRGEDNPDNPEAGQPTPGEWDALNAETRALEQRIDDNAERS